MSLNCQRYIRWYGLHTDELVGEHLLTTIKLTELKKHFDFNEDLLMVYCYELSSKHIDYFNYMIPDLELSYGSYDYFLDCDLVE